MHAVCVSDGEEQRNVGPKTMGDRFFCYLLRQPVCSLKLSYGQAVTQISGSIESFLLPYGT